MIALTIPQAADRLYTTTATIGHWIADGQLLAVHNPIDGQWYIEEEQLLDVERSHRRTGDAPTVRPELRPIAGIARWLTEHGKPITTKGVETWVTERILRASVPGRRGPGGAALFDPIEALAVYMVQVDAPHSKLAR